MRRRGLPLLAVLLLGNAAFGLEALTCDPYDYAAHQRLATEAHQQNRSSLSLYHIAWLVWLAPHEYTKIGEGFLRESARVSNVGLPSGSPTATVVILAATGRREVARACGRGVLPSQSARLQATLLDLVQQAERSQAKREENDPIARIALADLNLTLDDAMRLAGAADKDRKPVLQRAVSLADSVARALPEAPGAPRLAAFARTRLADLSNAADAWDSALTSGTRALDNDPNDPVLWELMWALHLRAGHWDEAKLWQRQCEQGERRSVRPVRAE